MHSVLQNLFAQINGQWLFIRMDEHGSLEAKTRAMCVIKRHILKKSSAAGRVSKSTGFVSN